MTEAPPSQPGSQYQHYQQPQPYPPHQPQRAPEQAPYGQAEEIGKVIGVSRATVYRMLKDDAAQQSA